ncbi:hypothetical protein NEPAR04_0741 [Nematocida parisii]|nr:hypothetical protein NEPAR08_0742 [Nematocida parisii]KAI5127617.1 hypothetical protein NEPAR03_1007 [Nematocida parisii]KAI5141170.1 hypothetical protein NEPAR04_0741 [Nematocida parisii]
MPGDSYIIECLNNLFIPQIAISRMRIVEIGDELLYSEVLTDKTGRIMIFDIINKNKEKKKGIVVIERVDRIRREHYLFKVNTITNTVININNVMYEIRHKIAHQPCYKAYYNKNQIEYAGYSMINHINTSKRGGADLVSNDTVVKDESQNVTEKMQYSVYPCEMDSKSEEIISMIVSETKERNTSISTRIISNNGTINYILSISGYKIDNGIEKRVTVLFITSGISTAIIIKYIKIYNIYSTSGIKEAIMSGQPSQSSVGVSATGKGPSESSPVEKLATLEDGKECGLKNNERSSRYLNYFLEDVQVGNISVHSAMYYDIIYHVLLEHRMLFLSHSNADLANYIQAVIMSILPYRWRGILLSHISTSYKKLIETTIPYILGMTSSAFSESKYIPDNTVIVSLDENRIYIHNKAEDRRMFKKLYKNMDGRRSLPFYHKIIKKMSHAWPGLKEEMNILMEIISTEVSTAREKVIQHMVQQGNKRGLRDFINTNNYAREILMHLRASKGFYKEFIGTSLYNEGIQNEYLREVKRLGLTEEHIVTIMWILMCTALEGIQPKRDIGRIIFIIEAYVNKYVGTAYQAADALLVSLFCLLSYLDMYDVIMHTCFALQEKGMSVTDDMCSALMPAISTEDLCALRKSGAVFMPWNKKKEVGCPQREYSNSNKCSDSAEVLPRDSSYSSKTQEKGHADKSQPDHAIPHTIQISEEDLWDKLSFTHAHILDTLQRYVCISEEHMKEEDRAYIQVLYRAFDVYELPY